MPKKETTETFINRSKDTHGDKYDYSLTEYVSSREKVIIVCSEHGKFEQEPVSHIRGRGCPQCGIEARTETKTKTQEQFIKEAVEIHGGKYDYSLVEYTNNKGKIKSICPEHGIFEQTSNSHLSGHGCPKCHLEKVHTLKLGTTLKFIDKAVNVHGDKYEYKKTEYGVNSKENVTITCKHHGDFQQMPNSHLSGQGCPKCGKESHWGRSEYVKKAKGRVCTLYTIKCFNENEEFYKIGRTMNSVKKRYSSERDMPYIYETVSEIFGSADEIWDLEIVEKRKLNGFNYQPKLKFAGSKTECFIKYKIENNA